LNHRQRLAWLRLIRSENVGPATFRALVNEFGGAEAAIEALPMLSRRGGRIHEMPSLVAIGEPGYPPALAQVDALPPLLYAKGRLDLADIPIVAIVGARNGSAVGQKFTRALATDLGLEGFVIAQALPAASIRRLMLPLSSAAPSPCLQAASTMSIRQRTKSCTAQSASKVSSSASDRPASLHALGLPTPQPPHLWNFTWRSGGRGCRALRLLDHGASCWRAGARGLCRARQSTRSAFRRHRQSPEARRLPHHQRARHYRCLAPILGRRPQAPAIELASSDDERTPEPLPDIGASERELIVGALGPSPVDIDELIRSTRLPTRKVHIVLLELDLAGRLQRHGHQLVSLIER
jgi:DNA processing protein